MKQLTNDNFLKSFEEREYAADEGILYIAFGHSFTLEGIMSYKSLRRYMPDIPVCFMTDAPESLADIEDPSLITVKIVPQHIRSKVDFVGLTPFRKTLYLDSDTLIVRDVSDIFQSLDRFDVALTHDYARKRTKYSNIVPEYERIPYAFSEVNGGVFGFNANKRTEDFLQLWKEYFYKYFQQTNGWDQVSLRISLWESDVKLFHMPFEYNIRSQANREKQDRFKHEFGEQHMAPRIYHMHYSPEVHQGKFNITTLEELEKSILEQAVWY
jgi:hypothetical protein